MLKASQGMTLLDYFAAKALPIAFDHVRRVEAGEDTSMADLNECRYEFNWVSNDGAASGDCEMVAEYAYLMADAMLKARNER
jgi:hypothetical protein